MVNRGPRPPRVNWMIALRPRASCDSCASPTSEPRASRRRAPRLAALVCCALTLASAQSLAQAQPERVVDGRVVALDKDDIIVDLAAPAGATVGTIVEIWRPLRLRHPVTGKMLTDRFRIGTLRLVQVGASLSLATPTAELSRLAEPGDIVVLRSVGPLPTTEAPRGVEVTPPPTDGAGPAAANNTPAGPPSDDAVALSAMFEGLRGSDPVTRIRTYESYVRANPRGKYAVVLYEEAQALRRLLLQEHAEEHGDEQPTVKSFRRPREVMEGSALQLGMETQGVARGAVLHVRSAGDVAYQSIPMGAEGPGYWSATLESERVRAPRLEYFVEATKPDGRAVPVLGEADQPVVAIVHTVPRPEPPPKRDATVSFLTDFADYNRLEGNDYAWQSEGWFALRYDDVGVRAVRSGFGVYRGAGGTIEDLDVLNRAPRRIGLTYGYLELELGVSPFVSLIARGAVGLKDEGTSGGGQGMIRIGNDRSTNLLLGGEFLGGVGLRGFTQLELNTFPRVPIVLRSEVTNQPAGVSDSSPRSADDTRESVDASTGQGDLGARGIVQVGYRIVPAVTVSVRGSYQGRTIKHAGPGVGAGLSYQW